jgi:chloramphenicol-sensitive protein RarD
LTGGLSFALGAYVIWGFLPLYFRALHGVPPVELVAWRVLFTLPLCLAIITARRQWPDLRAAVASRGTVLRLVASAVLIGGNWLLYVAAIQQGHVLAASLGYYINPLLNVVLGTVVLGERLNRTRWAAVTIAAVGIALLLWGALDMLGIALTLAVSFALYGLVRKTTPVGAVPGLTIETAVLVLPAAGGALWFAGQPSGSSMAAGPFTATLLVGSGVLTGVPLLLFALAARRLDLSTLGFVQFLSPTIAFLLGVLVFREPLNPVKLACFVLIWLAIALFSHDMWKNRVRRQA